MAAHDEEPRSDDALADDLHATAEDVAADAAKLQAIEEEKQGLDPSDPRVLTLSKEGVRIASDLGSKTEAEHELATEASGS